MLFAECLVLCLAHRRCLLRKRGTSPSLQPAPCPCPAGLLLVPVSLSVTLPLHRRPQAGLFKTGGSSLEPPPHLVQAASEISHDQGLCDQAGAVGGEAWVGLLPTLGWTPGFLAWADPS